MAMQRFVFQGGICATDNQLRKAVSELAGKMLPQPDFAEVTRLYNAVIRPESLISTEDARSIVQLTRHYLRS